MTLNGEEEVTSATITDSAYPQGRPPVRQEGDLLSSWLPEIQKVARKAAIDWPAFVEQEVLAQEVYLHILERPGTLRDLAGMDHNSRYRTLHKIAQRIASQERSDLERFSGNFRYSVDEVRGLLEATADNGVCTIGSSWSTGDYYLSGSDHSDPTSASALRHLSVSEAQKRLGEALDGLRASNPNQYDALIKRFGDGEIPHREDTATFMVIERALVSLTTRMNHGHKRQHSPTGDALVPGKSLGDGPGTRTAISNSTARYLSKEGWDADYTPAPAHLRDNHIEPEVWE